MIPSKHRHVADGADRPWDPWRELCHRRHLKLQWGPLVDEMATIEDWLGDGQRVVTLAYDLTETEAFEALTHEMVHDELDLLWLPETSAVVVDAGEWLVDRITRIRLEESTS